MGVIKSGILLQQDAAVRKRGKSNDVNLNIAESAYLERTSDTL